MPEFQFVHSDGLGSNPCNGSHIANLIVRVLLAGVGMATDQGSFSAVLRA